MQALCELQLDAIQRAKDIVADTADWDQLAALIAANAEAITTYRATVIDDGETEDAHEDRLDSPSEGQREA